MGEAMKNPALGTAPYKLVCEMRGMDGPATWMVLDVQGKFLGDFGPAEDWSRPRGNREVYDGKVRAELFIEALNGVSE